MNYKQSSYQNRYANPNEQKPPIIRPIQTVRTAQQGTQSPQTALGMVNPVSQSPAMPGQAMQQAPAMPPQAMPGQAMQQVSGQPMQGQAMPGQVMIQNSYPFNSSLPMNQNARPEQELEKEYLNLLMNDYLKKQSLNNPIPIGSIERNKDVLLQPRY